uniref:Neuromedin-S n=1 Tax=Cynoglossus semilaevis TaxID=244447 RepID=A0A3P8UWP5_CYNSE
MAVPSARQVFLLCFLWFLGCGRSTTGAVRSDDVSDVELRDQEEVSQEEDRESFLFHYSKARDSLGAIQHESHSVHPLMRLLPKLSQRRKVLLLKI